MVSPYLDKPRRSRAEVLREIIANCAETYLIVDMTRRGEPYLREGDVGQSFDRVVKDLADGQYDFPRILDGRPTNAFEAPLAVIRISLRDNEAEDVTEKVAHAVGEHIAETDGREWRECPFLDEVWPNWKQEQRRVA